MLETLKIYDSTTTLDLLGKEGSPGIRYLGWTPSVPSAKGGGVRASSATGWGSKLVYKAWENISDVFTLVIHAECPDDKIYWAQELRRLLEKAEAYWKTSWQNDPVIIEAKGTGETNTRYSIIKAYVAPDDSDPYIKPFPIDSEFILGLEHTLWHDKPPLSSTCTPLSSYNEYSLTQDETFVPTDSSDDAHVEYNTGTISLANPDLLVGNSLGNSWGFGVRFRTVTIPAGSTITYAGLLLYSTCSPVTDLGNTSLWIRGQLNIAPAIFSTFANYNARVRTAASKTFEAVPYTVLGSLMVFEGLESIVQEIIDLPGWASGNNLVIFADGLSSPNAATKRYAAIDRIGQPEPQLIVKYTAPQGYVGTIAFSCNDDHAYITNHHKYLPLTHVFYYDASVPAYSVNLINTVPSILLPNIVGIGDILYIMVSDVTLLNFNEAFFSAVFNLTNGDGYTGVWEFSVAAGWADLGVAQGYTDTTGGLLTVGECGVFWDTLNIATAPNVWIRVVINGITGYALRFRVTALTAIGVAAPPIQNVNSVYTVGWPHVEVEGSSILGDVPALMQTKLKNSRELDAAHPTPERVLMGTRSLSRGSDFYMCLNAYDVFGSAQGIPPILGREHPDIACLVTWYANWTANFPDLWAPINHSLTWNPAGAASGEIYWRIQAPTASSFLGRYRVFARITNVSGDSGITLKFLTGTSTLVFGSNRMAIYLYGEEVPVIESVWPYQLVDLGVHDIPAIPIDKPGDEPEALIVGMNITNTGATPELKVYDLILVPQDEFSWEIVVPNTGFTSPGFTFGVIGAQDPTQTPWLYGYARADSIWTKLSMQGKILAQGFDTLVSNWRASTPLFNGLQANSDQRQYFLSMQYYLSDNLWFANPFTHFTVQDWMLYQYLSMRGNR